MRLNPFTRPSHGRYSDDEEEDMVITGLKQNGGKRRPAGTPRRKMNPAGPEMDDDDYDLNDHYQPTSRGREEGRGRPRSRSRSNANRRPANMPPPDGRKRMSGNGSQRDTSTSYSSNNSGSASRSGSRPRGRSATPDARKPRNPSNSRYPSSSPERRRRPQPPPPNRRRGSGPASGASSSRRSKSSNGDYTLSSSEDEDERLMNRNQRRKNPPPPNNRRRGRSPGEPIRARGGRSHFDSEDEDDDDGDDGARSRGRVVPLSSMRHSRSRGASPSSDDADNGNSEMRRPPQQRRKSGSHQHRPRSASRSRPRPEESLQSGSRNKKQQRSKSKPQKSSWGFKMPGSPFVRRKPKRDTRDDEVDVESAESEDFGRKSDNSRRGSHGGMREAPPPQVHPPQPDFPVARLDEHKYVIPKREKYANLYEYDNFPAIDRVPTAIGYRSDDSDEDAGEHGGCDDNASATSRYTVDVKSVRGSKLKKNKRIDNSHLGNRYMDPDADDNFSHDENDDKYAQYLAGAKSNNLMSDSSESCPPTWHPALDVEDSDWFEDDEAAIKKMKKQQAKNKKYQVSESKPQSNKKKKVPVSSDPRKAMKEDKLLGRKQQQQQQQQEEETEEALNDEEEQDVEDDKGDAIVANRSEADDIIPGSSRHPGPKQMRALGDEDSDEDEMQERPPPRTRKQRGGNPRRKGFDLDDEEDEDYQLEEETHYTDDSNDDTHERNRKQQTRKFRKAKEAAMNGNAAQGRKHNMKSLVKGKSKGKGLKGKFKGFRRGGRSPAVQYASSSDESSDISESVGVAPIQSLNSEDPFPNKVDPALAKLELDEFKESTATHNMIRNNRKELLELDEMDEVSVKGDSNAFCGAFPFASLGLGGGESSGLCSSSRQPRFTDEIQLDSIQMQRLKDAKHDLENKPKVEVILQDLQDPLAEKYDQLEKKQRKQQREVQREKQVQQEIEKREREELLRMKKEMRETEQKKIQMAQNRDQLALQEAPDLNRGKSQSFVMDISDWVLNLDNNDPPATTPRKKPAAATRENPTPRTNGRDESSPIEKLPFSTIEVPTTIDNHHTGDGHLQPPKKTQQGWRRKKRGGNNSNAPPRQGSYQHGNLKQKNGTAVPQHWETTGKKHSGKKKGWFRR